jgi:WD40 repeat protein
MNSVEEDVIDTRLTETPAWDVFVSYARVDLGFVRDLVGALRNAGHNVWVDLDGLYAGEQWWTRICTEIEAANTILLVLSPASAESAACRAEIEHAVRHSKRILPVLLDHPGHISLPGALASTQWMLAFQQSGSFTAGMDALCKALDADPKWVRGHTRWLQRALDWDRRGRPRDLLLNGDHLVEAERWLDEASPHREPAESALHLAYLGASRQHRLFSRAREYLLAPGREIEALETAVAACERSATETLELHTADFATLCDCTKRVRRAFPLRGHGGQVWNLGVDTSGERAVTLGTDGCARLWDLTDFPPRLVARLEGAGGSKDEATVFSPNGPRILTRKFETATLWDAVTGAPVAQLKAGNARVPLSFSRDGRYVIGVASDKALLWSSSTGELERTLDCPGCRQASLTADGELALTRAYFGVRIWNLLTGEQCCELRTGKRWGVSAARFSPDGTRVVTANGTRRARVWSATDGESLGVLDCKWEIDDARFSADGKLILARGSGHFGLWRAGDGAFLPVPGDHDSVVLFALSPDGRDLLTTNLGSGEVQVWDIAQERAVDVLGHGAEVTAVEWSPDGRLVVTAGEDGVVRVWDWATRSTSGSLDARGGAVSAVMFLPHSQGILAGYSDGAARLWRFGDSLAAAIVERNVWRLEMAPRGGVAVVVPKENEPLWVCATTTLKRLATLQTGLARNACFSPDGRWIAVADKSGILYLIDAREFEIVRSWPASRECVKLCYSGNGERLLVLGSPAAIWNMPAGEHALILDNDTRRISKAEFSPDGARLCIAETEYSVSGMVLRAIRHSARILDAASGEELAALGEYRNGIDDIRFSPTGDRVILIESGRGVICDAATGQVQRYLGELSERLVHSAAFYPDGNRLLTGGPEGEFRVWNLSTGECVKRSTGERRSIKVVFSPDGSRFATYDLSVAQLWDAETCVPLAAYSDGLKCYAWNVTFDPGGDRLIIIHASGGAGVYPVSAAEFVRLASRERSATLDGPPATATNHAMERAAS